MPIWLKIVIAIIILLAAIYILGMIITVLFARIFHNKLNRRMHNINLLLTQKCDIIRRIKDTLITQKILIDKKLLSNINSLSKNVDLSKLDAFARLNLLNDFSSYTSIFEQIVDKNCHVLDYEEYFLNIKGIDDLLRQNIAIYNSNVLGYNYWINVFWYRYLFILFKSHPYQRIE